RSNASGAPVTKTSASSQTIMSVFACSSATFSDSGLLRKLYQEYFRATFLRTYCTCKSSNLRSVECRSDGPKRGVTAITGACAKRPPQRRRLSTIQSVVVSSGPASTQQTTVADGAPREAGVGAPAGVRGCVATAVIRGLPAARYRSPRAGHWGQAAD